MKLFIDSGNIKDIETLAAIGIIDGVTTNPTLSTGDGVGSIEAGEEALRISRQLGLTERTAFTLNDISHGYRDLGMIDRNVRRALVEPVPLVPLTDISRAISWH